MKHQYSVLVLLLMFFNSGPVFCQQITFNKVPFQDNKTFDWVSDITQDVNGFMWFATKKGLFSYDGNRIISYKNDPKNPNSIISELLESVYADKDGIIWIGSLGKGLDRLNTETGIFTHFHHNPSDPASLSCDTVTTIFRDRQGTLWIGTHGGLDYFDQKSNKFSHYRYNANDPGSISNNQVRALFEDSKGTLWIGTGSPYPDNGGGPETGGLNRLDKKTGRFTRYLHDPNNIHSLLTNKVSAIFEDNKGVLWIGTSGNGLHKMNIQQGTFERIAYDPLHPGNLSLPAMKKDSPSYEHISFIAQDAAGSYWFGTSDAGIFYFNAGIGKIAHYSDTENTSAGFIDAGAWKAFTSRDGILWIGGTKGGIYHLDPIDKHLHHTSTDVIVNGFYEEPDGVLWMGTGKGLIRNDRKNGITKRYLMDAKTSKSDGNFIYSLQSDRRGGLWAGGNGGLYLFDKQNGKFIQYKRDPKNSNSLSNNNVISIYEDSKANFWIGTFRGFNLMDRNTGLFKRFFVYPADTFSFGPNTVTDVLEDKPGKMWVSTWNGGGVHLFNHGNNKFKSYLKGASFMTLFMDSEGVLWAGAREGLYKFNPGIDNFIRFVDSASMTGIVDVIGIIEDDQKYLWIKTTDGLVRLNPGRNETTVFGRNYGINKNMLAYGSCYKGLNGDLYFGDTSGYYSFSPKELARKMKPPQILITNFRLANQAVTPGDGGPLKESLSKVKNIRLRYNQNVFSFDFTVIDFADPEGNRMIYKLQNYDNEWNQANSDRKAYYFNVPPGKYTFRVKAVNGYGVWAEKTLEVIIMPPWWRSWWAYVFYGLMLIAFIYGIDRFQRRRILKSEKEKNRQSELAHAKQIEKAYAELKETQTQLIQSEKMASLGELTAGIAHEIQNPLNFVNNFSEVNTELIDEMQHELDKGNLVEAKAISNDIKENEQKINHHGKRADAIVKGMLLHSRSSNGQKEPTDINALADEYLRLSYHGLRAKDKSFNATMKTDFDPGIGKINVLPQDIGRVILNLLTNAFYAVNDKKKLNIPGYEPVVSVSTKKLKDKIEIKVIDNGNGIPQQLMDKIFQPFFTTKPTGEGTGLGLSLSYDIITKGHGGELKVETKEGEQTTFIIHLPA